MSDFKDLVTRIKSSQLRERSDAVLELKQEIRQYERNPNGVKDKVWNEVFDALFQSTSTEKSIYVKGLASARTPVKSRLENCASTLRAVVQVAVAKLRIRTVKKLLEHIIQTLPTKQGLCEPLATDYLKALRCVLEYQPHVEHLRETWNEVVFFCITGLGKLQDQVDDDGQSGPLGFGLSGSRTSRLGSKERLGLHSYTSFEADELVACMRSLCRAPNAPIESRASEMASVLLRHLQLKSSFGSSQLDAISAINLILHRILYSNLDWARQIILDMIPILTTLWLHKSDALKDDILVFLVISRRHLEAIFRKDPANYARFDLETFLEAAQDEYASRQVREQLKLDDLSLSHSLQTLSSLPIAGSFKLRDGYSHAESQYITVYALAWIASLLDETREDSHEVQRDDGARKRRRVTSKLEALLQLLTSTNNSVQITSLQILSFLPVLSPLSKAKLTQLSKSLMPLMAHTNGNIASWAMLALANCASLPTAKDFVQIWPRVWDLASRAIPAKTTARSASLLLDVVLHRKLVDYSIVAQSFENMLQFAELTGPGIIAESTISFWMTTLQTISQEAPGNTKGLHEKLLRWMFSKWTPSK
jgi:serine-protein kinase ATM